MSSVIRLCRERQGRSAGLLSQRQGSKGSRTCGRLEQRESVAFIRLLIMALRDIDHYGASTFSIRCISTPNPYLPSKAAGA